MASLDDIWNTPAETVSSNLKSPLSTGRDDDDDEVRRNPKPRRSAARPLFLDSDSENEAPTSGKPYFAVNKNASKPDIDAFWDDLDAEPDTAFKQLAPSLDVDALKRQADAAISLTPHQILPSSSPPRDLGDEDEGGKAKGKGKNAKDGLKKRKRPTLDEGRLLGPNGFPVLLKQAKDFKPKGKGHELSDLNRLLNVYQFWSHKMYPNTQFIDTVQRVEKLCHTKRMHVALSVWRDEAKGLINGHKIPDPNNPDRSGSASDSDHDDAAGPNDIPIATEDERSSPAPSRGPSLPPSSASEPGGLDDDFDIDAMIAEEEAAWAQQASASTFAHETRPTAASSSIDAPDLDDDEAMWDAMGDVPHQPYVSPDRPSAPAPHKRTQDEDEDMWDLVPDLEMEDAHAGAKAPTPSSGGDEGPAADPSQLKDVVTGTGVLVGADPTRPATNDEGWDEMYA